MPEISTQTDNCVDIINRLNSEFDILYYKNEELEEELRRPYKIIYNKLMDEFSRSILKMVIEDDNNPDDTPILYNIHPYAGHQAYDLWDLVNLNGTIPLRPYDYSDDRFHNKLTRPFNWKTPMREKDIKTVLLDTEKFKTEKPVLTTNLTKLMEEWEGCRDDAERVKLLRDTHTGNINYPLKFEYLYDNKFYPQGT